MNRLIPYAGYDPLEHVRESNSRRPTPDLVLAAFRAGHDTAVIAAELAMREPVVLRALTIAREAERRGRR